MRPTSSMRDNQRIPRCLRRAVEGTVFSFHQRHFQLGEEGGDVVAQVEEIGERAWRVWLRQPAAASASVREPRRLALQTTRVYWVEVLRVLARNHYELGLLPYLEVVCSRGLQVGEGLDRQVSDLLTDYALGWGRRSVLPQRLFIEVASSDLVLTRCFSPEDRLWTVRQLSGSAGTQVGKPEALVLLHGRQLALVSQWTLLLDQVFVRQQRELQRVLDVGLAQLARGQAPGPLRVTAFGPLDARTLAAIDPGAERGWQIEAQPGGAGPRWDGGGLVAIVLQRGGRGGFASISFRPTELDRLLRKLAAHASTRGGEA